MHKRREHSLTLFVGPGEKHGEIASAYELGVQAPELVLVSAQAG
jgi:hypothetical protein